MKVRRIKALFKKELIQIVRDPRSLALAIAIPVLLLFLFGYALTLDVDNVPLAVWDQDRSQTSADLLLKFRNSRYFNIIRYADNYRDLQSDIDKGEALMALVIPSDFSKLLESGRPAPVQLIVDGSDSSTATIATGYVEGLISRYNVSLIVGSVSKLGLQDPYPVDVRPRVWFNEDLKSRNFIIPGLIAVIMMVIAALLTSLTVSREWERGTMEQLISTPVRAGELILGKFLPYFFIGFIDLLIAVVVGQFVYNVPLRGSVALLFVLSSLFLAAALVQGMFISIATKNQLLSSQLAIITTFLPAFLLSGFVYTISNMPKVIQVITHIVAARYFIAILKGIYLKGVGVAVLSYDIAFLIIFTIVMTALANKKFRKKVA